MTGAGIMTELPLLPGDSWGSAQDMSDDGRVIVGSSGPSRMDTRPVRWVNGAVEPMADPTSQMASVKLAQFVSDDGDTAFAGGFDTTADAAQWLRWTAQSGWQVIHTFPAGCCTPSLRGATGDGSLAVGHRFAGAGTGPYVWQSGVGAGNLVLYLRDRGLDMSGWSDIQALQMSTNARSIIGISPARGHFVARIIDCYADCDQSTTLDIFDFLCFQDLFAAGDPTADCDGNTILDVFDFLCFQDAFATGCP